MDPLTQSQLQQLQQDLEALQKSLEATLAFSAEGAKPVDLDKPIGRLSRMDEMQQQQMVRAARRGHETRLLQVRAALQRLAEQEYGECGSCGELIPLRRLRARPESRFCVGCQQTRER